jgi:hypothetical protein
MSSEVRDKMIALNTFSIDFDLCAGPADECRLQALIALSRSTNTCIKHLVVNFEQSGVVTMHGVVKWTLMFASRRYLGRASKLADSRHRLRDGLLSKIGFHSRGENDFRERYGYDRLDVKIIYSDGFDCTTCLILLCLEGLRRLGERLGHQGITA